MSCTLLSKYADSLDFERSSNSSSRSHDVSPVLLPELQESGGTPDRSSTFQYEDVNDFAAEDGDSKEEVRSSDLDSCINIITSL